jgi:hypothetical protein
MNTQRFRGRSPRTQRGFGMAAVLAVLAVMALIGGAIALANKGGAQKTDLEAAKAMAQTVINRGNELYTAVIRVSQDRNLSEMTLTNASVAGVSWGLYDPAIGVARDVVMPGKALTTNVDASFTLDKTNITVNVGNGNFVAAAVVLSNVTTATCQMINKTIYNSSIDAALTTIATGTPTSNEEGCAIVGGVNTYYKVLGAA